MKATNLKLHVKLALGYFLVAALLGVLLRSFNLFEIPLNYKFIVHTHSHIALIGWVYLPITTLLYKLFLSAQNTNRSYQKIFWFTQLTILGMLFTFPFTGYALFSIIFSTLFLFASYWFCWFFLKTAALRFRERYSYKFVKASLWYLVISSLGPWTLGAIMNSMGAESVWYRMAIYFYLHFMYNGFMILALVGLLCYVFEEAKLRLDTKTMKMIFWLFNSGLVLSFFLSTLFAEPPMIFNLVGGSGAVLQFVALGVLIMGILKRKSETPAVFRPFQTRILITIGVLMVIKMLLQLLSAVPYYAGLAAAILDFTIGYLHLTFLGVISLGLFLFLNYFDLLKISKNYYTLYFIGFVLSEALIFYRAITAWGKFELIDFHGILLSGASLLMLIGLSCIFLDNAKLRFSKGG
ncbi:MAG: hypothetical protein AB3N14_12800 [Flavobacteriaceae bacterium]